jgi:hypothetical protein
MSKLVGKYVSSGSVDARILADDAVETPKIKNSNVTREKIADSAINVAKIDSAILNAAGGLVQLNGSTKIPVELLPNTIVEYKAMFAPGVTGLVDYADDVAAGIHVGDVYRASVAGDHNFGTVEVPRVVHFEVGDYAICDYNGKWERADTSDAVTSVNGKNGIVTLGTDDVAEGSSNKYFTDARAKAAAVVDGLSGSVTDVAPSQKAVVDALALKASLTDLASVANAKGASLIGIEDAAAGFTATNVEGALAEAMDVAQSAQSDATQALTNASNAATVAAQVDTKIGNHIGDAEDAHDASAISVADAGGHFTATNVEGALVELKAEISTVATAAQAAIQAEADARIAAIAALSPSSELITLDGTMVSAKAFDLAKVPTSGASIMLFPLGGLPQSFGVLGTPGDGDFTLGTGAANKTISWDGRGMDDLSFAIGDKIRVIYFGS